MLGGLGVVVFWIGEELGTELVALDPLSLCAVSAPGLKVVEREADWHLDADEIDLVLAERHREGRVIAGGGRRLDTVAQERDA